MSQMKSEFWLPCWTVEGRRSLLLKGLGNRHVKAVLLFGHCTLLRSPDNATNNEQTPFLSPRAKYTDRATAACK
jgi:hypothetical protein